MPLLFANPSSSGGGDPSYPETRRRHTLSPIQLIYSFIPVHKTWILCVTFSIRNSLQQVPFGSICKNKYIRCSRGVGGGTLPANSHSTEVSGPHHFVFASKSIGERLETRPRRKTLSINFSGKRWPLKVSRRALANLCGAQNLNVSILHDIWQFNCMTPGYLPRSIRQGEVQSTVMEIGFRAPPIT